MSTLAKRIHSLLNEAYPGNPAKEGARGAKDDDDRAEFVVKTNQRINTGLRKLSDRMAQLRKEADMYSGILSGGQQGWTYSGDLGRVAETIEDCLESTEWVDK